MRGRALPLLKRTLVVAVACSGVVFLPLTSLQVAAAVVGNLALVGAFAATTIIIFTTAPGESYLATSAPGKARESSFEHAMAQLAAVMLAFLAWLGWGIALGLKASGNL